MVLMDLLRFSYQLRQGIHRDRISMAGVKQIINIERIISIRVHLRVPEEPARKETMFGRAFCGSKL
jgi:hypothetical protein